jgi:hypothetical protein
VFDPTFLREVLRKLLISGAGNDTLMIDQECRHSGGATIYREYAVIGLLGHLQMVAT